MEELKRIIKGVSEIGIELKLNFSADMILDCSTRIFNNPSYKKENALMTKSNLLMSKESLINNELSQEKRNELKATDKQINYLKKNRIKFDSNLTKQEAYLLIKKDKEGKDGDENRMSRMS